MKIIYLIGIILLILIASVSAYLIFNDSKEPRPPVVNNSPVSNSTRPSVPSRCSLVQKNDSYEKPDFERLKSIMAGQDIVKDVPEKGSISLKFYHFTENCRIWDKSYILSNGEIKEGSGTTDIQIWISSNYVNRIDENNFCDIIKEARSNGDLGQDSTVGEATLLWRYKSMLKYRECLGINI